MGARHVSPEEIIEMQRLYRIYGTFSAVARETGRSASTVSKFVRMKNVPKNIRIIVENISSKGENKE